MAVLPTKGNLIATKHSLELANTGFELRKSNPGSIPRFPRPMMR